MVYIVWRRDVLWIKQYFRQYIYIFWYGLKLSRNLFFIWSTIILILRKESPEIGGVVLSVKWISRKNSNICLLTLFVQMLRLIEASPETKACRSWWERRALCVSLRMRIWWVSVIHSRNFSKVEFLRLLFSFRYVPNTSADANEDIFCSNFFNVPCDFLEIALGVEELLLETLTVVIVSSSVRLISCSCTSLSDATLHYISFTTNWG